MRIKRCRTRLFRMNGFWISPYWIRLIVMGAIAVGVIWAVIAHTRIHFNRTESAPYHAFVCVNGLKAGLGDYVSIEAHKTDYFNGLHFTKQIMGLPGDDVETEGGQVSVGCHLIGPLLSKTTQGLKLTPLDAKEIPEGYVFVAGDHSRSFDSRYQEFGLVKLEHIKGRCFGFWKRKGELL